MQRYTLVLIGTWGLLATLVLGVNLLVDPLWYWKGNQISGVNLKFNERESKLTHLTRHLDAYDCLIFGSSRATFLQPDSFPGYRCFNLAFSAGQVAEFIAFARYLGGLGANPRLVIVGVDAFNFYDAGRDPLNVPAYLYDGNLPPSLLPRYVSFDALRFSWRTLSGDSPLPGAYDDRFRGIMLDNAPRFRPDVSLDAEGLSREDDAARQARPFNPAYAALYGQLRQQWPQSRFIAYVPPISAWHVDRFDRLGVLDGYIAALHACAPYFDDFWDFSVPSAHTWITTNTHDGTHYSPEANREMAEIMNGVQASDFGVKVSTLDLEQHHAAYRKGLARFRDLHPQGAPPIAKSLSRAKP